GDDGEHAGEEAGPGGAFEEVPAGAGVHGGEAVPATGVQLGLDGREHEVHALLGAEREVGVEGARVAVEVLAGPELERVDEDGGDHRVRDLAGFAQVRAVALVQRPHGGDDGDAAG